MQLIRLPFRLSVGIFSVAAAIGLIACSSEVEDLATSTVVVTAVPQANSVPASVSAAVAGSTATVESIPTLIPISPAPIGGDGKNRIVFVSPDSQIYTIQGDGTDRVRMSPDRAQLPQDGQFPGYTWPGWSPDASKILFSAAMPESLSVSPFVLLSTNSDGTSVDFPEVLYENEPGSGNVVAGGPHYSLWSPDSEKEAFISGTADGLTVFVVNTVTKNAVRVVPGAPVYMDWSYDSTELVVHNGNRLLTYDAPFWQGPSSALDGGSIRYFAPDYAPEDDRLLFLVDTSDGAALHMSNPSSGVLERVTDAGAAAWFKWSPDGGSIMLLRGSLDVAGESTISIVDPDTGTEEFIARGDYLMSMWSPDGQKLLLAKRNRHNTLLMQWSIYDRDTKLISDLIEFEPSGELRMMHVFFDQYIASHSFWSPDSESIVFAGDLIGPLSDLDDAERDIDTVWVVNASGEPRPKAIAEGFMAFWSPE